MDLARFVSKGQVDSERFIDPKTARARGETERSATYYATIGATYYATIGATCHGAKGGDVVTMRPLGDLARRSPWKTLRMILNGHPDRVMPPLRVLAPKVVADLLADLQRLAAD